MATAAESRLLEAVLLNTLAELELTHGESFGTLHGNIPHPFKVGPNSIPTGWNLARRRYLERCVGLFGVSLATAGIHTNHSFPEALLSWDYFHLPLAERQRITMEDYRNHAVIRATRLLRPYCPLFIAISAASPLSWEEVDGEPVAVLTDIDSQRLLAFPNPEELDVPRLYASHQDYLQISYDLVRRGVRFGANNWTPVRARSKVNHVQRNILASSDQLRELYRRGIYATGEHGSLEDAERDLIVENLCARVDLPMNRVEVRTDEGGDTFELSIAKILFKELLMLRIYAEGEQSTDYAYEADDVVQTRRDEVVAAHEGLDGVVSHPDRDGSVVVRELLGEVLDELMPLAEGLGCLGQLEPLREMAGGGPNPAGVMRTWLSGELGSPRQLASGAKVVPNDLLLELVQRRRCVIAEEVEEIANLPEIRGHSSPVLGELVSGIQEMARKQPAMPVRLDTSRPTIVVDSGTDRTRDVVDLAVELVKIPSVTNCPEERLDEVVICARYITGWLRTAGLEVKLYEGARYPSVVAGFPGQLLAPITLSGHFDVVPPEPDDRQFEPRIDGDYLWGRGTADMKTVVASTMVWMKASCAVGPPFPPINTILIGNEENGEGEGYPAHSCRPLRTPRMGPRNHARGRAHRRRG